MRLLIIACAALPISAATAEPPVAPPAGMSTSPPATAFAKIEPGANCPKPAFQPVKQGETPRMKRLGELPPAEAFHAVYRLDGNGCVDPVMVGYQYERR